jgi:hypothetical protein
VPLANVDFVSPPEVIGTVTSFFGGEIGLDPCSSEFANTMVCANRYFSWEQNGLKQQWKSKNVYIYPPRDFLTPGEQPPDSVLFRKKRRFTKSAQRIWLEECVRRYQRNEFDEAIIFLTSTEVALLVTQKLNIDFPICILKERPDLYLDEPGLPKLGPTKCFGFILYLPKLINPQKAVFEFREVFSNIGRVYC